MLNSLSTSEPVTLIKGCYSEFIFISRMHLPADKIWAWRSSHDLLSARLPAPIAHRANTPEPVLRLTPMRSESGSFS